MKVIVSLLTQYIVDGISAKVSAVAITPEVLPEVLPQLEAPEIAQPRRLMNESTPFFDPRKGGGKKRKARLL